MRKSQEKFIGEVLPLTCRCYHLHFYTAPNPLLHSCPILPHIETVKSVQEALGAALLDGAQCAMFSEGSQNP